MRDLAGDHTPSGELGSQEIRLMIPHNYDGEE